MQTKQATGIDTRMMVPVYFVLFSIFCQLAAPWLSIPVLKYSRLEPAYTVWEAGQCSESIQTCIATGGKLTLPPLTPEQMNLFSQGGMALAICSGILIFLLAVSAAGILCKWKKRVSLLRTAMLAQLLFTVTQFGCVLALNLFINQGMQRPSSFENLTIHSYVQLTSWVYAQMFLSLIFFCFAKQLICWEKEDSAIWMCTLTPQKRQGETKRLLLSVLLLLVAIPFVIFFGIYFLNDRSNVFIGLCIIGLSMLPFAMIFEKRKPQAREILLISVLSAIAVVGRLAFFMVPQFKPTAAIVILAGVTLGPEAGFLTGAVSAFVSNFLFGQGPWTPWQMFSFGIIGFLAGLLFYKRRNPVKPAYHRAALCAYGGVSVFLIYGLLMDFSAVINAYGDVTWALFAARIASGIIFNLIHAAATVFFLFLMSEPFERKIRRIQKKYGLIT